MAGATGGTTAPTTRRAAAAAKQSSTNSRAITTAEGKRATSSSKQKGNNADEATGTNTTAPSNQKGGINATAAIADAIGATTAAPTKQKGGVTTDSNDPGRSERMPTRMARNTSKHSTLQVAEKYPRHAAVVLNDGVQPSDDVDDAATEVFNDDKSPRRAAAETLVVLNEGVQPSDDVDEVANKACNDIDVNDYLNVDEGMDSWTSPLGLGMDDLEAGGDLKNSPENEEMVSAATHLASDCSLNSDNDGCHCE